MKAAGCEIKFGKHFAFKIPNGKQFIRCDSLGEDYYETTFHERISGKRIVISLTSMTGNGGVNELPFPLFSNP